MFIHKEKEIFEKNFLSCESLSKEKFEDQPDSEKDLCKTLQQIKMRNFEIQILTKKKIWVALLIFTAACLFITYLSQFCKDEIAKYLVNF